ncbi:SPL family radical SAM protein [Halobaculum gomorrense]|uniref:DNA repair photolyase n=1 Tax=Halobaculum gomorrense TaxID=43928 RepID=A0A1M5MLM5_9EURY|nr:radical SAM protein [Halobaculum gomorrense]SHG77663.1 DNA repair photolyase [Halobaculum gomorrense]
MSVRLDTKRDPDGGWYDRYVELVDDEGRVVKEFGKNPTLNELREAEREYGERINLWQQGLICSDCGNQINERFSADLEGNLLCWDCASEEDSSDQSGLRVNADPTKSVLSESKLYEKSLCDYVINVATGCRHGCKFCYVPSTPAIQNREEMLGDKAGVEDGQQEWGSYLLYRDDLPERLNEGLQDNPWEDWDKTDRGRGVVMLSSGTDCYQDKRAAQITRSCVHELVSNDVPVRILTRSPNLLRDMDLFRKAGEYVTVGMSIPSFDDELVRAMEPNAPPPMQRWKALEKLSKNQVRRFVSFSPTYPTMDEEEIHEALSWFSALGPEVVFHEPINPRGANFEMCVEAAENAGRQQLADDLRSMEDESIWKEYALEHIKLVRDCARRFDNIQIHSWPSRDLVRATKGETRSWLLTLREEVSPEQHPQ